MKKENESFLCDIDVENTTRTYRYPAPSIRIIIKRAKKNKSTE